jgi:molecular chaperone DnaK
MRVGIDFGTTHTVVAPSGAVEVTLTTHPAGFERTFRLERRVCAGV